MVRRHKYTTKTTWTGNTGTGTSGYRDYQRSHSISADGKQHISGSSDPLFRGDRGHWSPEELLVASLSACHQLWYLHLCADAGIVVEAYEDNSVGVMEELEDGAGQFIEVVLRPKVRLSPGSDIGKANALHAQAHAKCFIARSVNFPVKCEPAIDS
jgi:organic hydroperoxide reductase OsmC/OhrA